MKKFYFFMMALLVSLSSMAWTVKFTNPDNWATVAVWAWDDNANYTGGTWPGAVMTQDGDVWTYEGEGTPEFVIFNNNNNGSQTGNLTFVDGATYDMQGVVGAAKETYTVYFDNSKSNWDKVYVYTWTPEVKGWPGIELSKNAEGLYEWAYEATSEPTFGGFLFNDGVGSTIGEDKTADLTYEVGKTYDVDGLVEGGDTPVDPDPTPDTKSYKLNGQITGNELWEAVALEKNAEGNWEYTANFVAGEFGIQIMEDGAQTGWIGGAAEVTEADKAYPFGEGVNSSSTLEGTYTFVYNPTAGTVTFVPFQGEITVVKSYALRGNIVTGEWDDYALTEKNGAWEVELTVVPGDFGIKYMENGAQKGWFSAPTAADAAVESTGTFQAAGIGGTNWSSTLEGLYTFSFNPETEVLTISKTTTGIESIEVEEGVEAVYYNLQGVRVANPENGLYIRVAGKTASKVFIR